MWKYTSGHLITWFRLLPSPASVHLCVLMVLAAVQGTMAKLPAFVDIESNITANRGSEVVLTCGARHLGTKQIIWKKADIGQEHNILTVGKLVFTDDKSIGIQHKKENHKDLWNLIIKDVTLAHSGLYECQISTQEDLKRNIMLNVLDVKDTGNDKGIVLMGKAYVEKGDAIELTCNITGDVFLSSDVDWFKDGKKIHQDIYNGVHVHTSHVYETRTLHSVLTIEHSSMDDMGIYVCRSNAGSEVKITSLSVMVLNGKSNKEPRSKSGEMYVNPGQSGLDKNPRLYPPTQPRTTTSGPDDNQKYQRDINGKAENNQTKREKQNPAKVTGGAGRLLSKPSDCIKAYVLFFLTIWFSSSIVNVAQ